MKVTQIVIGFFVLIFSWSCSSDLDFDQANNLELRPIVEANLTSFDVAANKFVNNGVEQSLLIDTPGTLNFDDSFFKDNLIKADLFFEVNNTINRAYVLQFIFLNNANTPLTTIQVDVPAYAGTINITTNKTIYEGATLDLFKQTKKMTFVVTMLSGPPLSATSVGNLKLRSSVTAYFNIK